MGWKELSWFLSLLSYVYGCVGGLLTMMDGDGGWR